MHFPLDFDRFHNVPAVTFQPAIEVVKVDAADASRRPIVQFGWDGFAQRVMTLFLPSAHQIQTLFQQF